MTDFTDLIGQAKKMQEKMKETQEHLKKIEVEGISGGEAVKIVMNGEGEADGELSRSKPTQARHPWEREERHSTDEGCGGEEATSAATSEDVGRGERDEDRPPRAHGCH